MEHFLMEGQHIQAEPQTVIGPRWGTSFHVGRTKYKLRQADENLPPLACVWRLEWRDEMDKDVTENEIFAGLLAPKGPQAKPIFL